MRKLIKNYRGKKKMILITKIYRLWLFLLCWACLLGVNACTGLENLPAAPAGDYPVPPAQELTIDEFLDRAKPSQPASTPVSYNSLTAKYFDLVNQTFSLTPQERALLAQNGFVMTDRLAFSNFTTAYAYIYWKDLPVLVTTDSMLQVLHRLQDDLLVKLEETILTSKLTALLSNTRRQLQADAQTHNSPDLAPPYADLDIYLAVPLALLVGQAPDAPGAAHYLELVQAEAIAEVDLFGRWRTVDFSLFQPRGHYTKNEALQRYFRAMNWLALVDFPLVEYSSTGQPSLNPGPLTAAALLRQALDNAGERSTWVELDRLLGTLVGRSDNMTLVDLDRFLVDAGVKVPADLTRQPELLALLTRRDYGQQRIMAQILPADPAQPGPRPLPVSFRLLGQRFTLDSYLMNNLVYDRLQVDGHKVDRRLPSPLDVMYVLGNDQAAFPLQDELTKYGYQGNLAALRQAVDDYPADFWTGSLYNRRLGLLRTLDSETTKAAYPQAMHTSAWADKMLQTQLASYAQLRHDNILYVKPSFTGSLCDYPAGYVEPYPQFYTGLQDYAQAVHALFEELEPAGFTAIEIDLRNAILTKFSQLAAVAGQLQTLAEKELRQEPFSLEEEAFLKGIAVHHPADFYGPQWTGWYPQLFFEERSGYTILQSDRSSALIADIHSDPGSLLQPPSVLHVATGPVSLLLFIADTDTDPTLYIGPAFTYYEVVTSGYFFNRLTDEEWQQQLTGDTDSYPAAPDWTATFRLPASIPPTYLEPNVTSQ